MWANTRMVVLAAMSASLYAAILIPFKVIPLIPGITELRPANAVPVVCSFLFGPAAAWGAAIGNMIGDTFGGLGPGDVFGFLGDLGHPDRIAGGIEAVERGGIGIELVAENQNEGAHTGMETGGAKFGEWGSGSRR